MKVADGKATFYGSVVNMKDENISRDYIGVGYIKYVADGETHYKFATANENVRSMENIARSAYDKTPDYRQTLRTLYLNKVARDCKVISAPVAIENLNYTGISQTLVTAGVADEYSVMKYSLDGETFGEDIPVGTNAATYVVYYKAASKTDFDRDSDTGTVTAEITTAQKGTLTLNPAKITELKDDSKAVVGFGGTYDYVGLGEYSVGDTLEFRFRGQNIPNVGLFVSKNGVNPIGGGTVNTGIFLQTSGHGAVTYNKRLYISGPYLVDAGGSEYYPEGFNYRLWVGANRELGVDVESSPGKLSVFGLEMLDENTDYVYRVVTAEGSSASTVTVNTKLYTVSGDTETLIGEFAKTITHYLDSLENRYAVVYGAGDYYSKNENVYTGKQITFSYEVNPVKLTGALTLKSAVITEVKTNGNLTGFNGTYDYKGLGNYAVGDTLEFAFKGKNIPNLGLFVNKDGVNPVGGGAENTGVFLQTSGHGTATFDTRLYIVGPYLVDAGSVDVYKKLEGRADYAYRPELGKNLELGVKTNSFGISTLDDDTNYVYSVTTAVGKTDATVTIKAELYSVSGEEKTLLYDYTKEITHYLDTLENRYAVVYGAGDFYGKTIEFNYKIIKAA